LLARNPEPVDSFPTVLNNIRFTIYGFEGKDWGMPEMWVVYAANDDHVIIHGINAIEPDDSDDEE
jgi:hypothetical protein